ncbi:MAG: hypothetical protein JRJ20_06135 [Deltaproteobacteria bacterium]|nr:hypothetical protein [Deltaproteobacteria bacterium]
MTKSLGKRAFSDSLLVEFRLIGEIEGVHGEAKETQRIVLLKPTFHAKEYDKPRN